MQLTRNAEYALAIIYAEYRRREKAGFMVADCADFEDGALQNLTAFSDWRYPNIRSAISELTDAKYLKQNICGDITLQNSAIAYMQSKPKEFFKEVGTAFSSASGLLAALIPIG